MRAIIHLCTLMFMCKFVCLVCHAKANSLMCLPAFWLTVKPLHCSTASGISAGTALLSLFLALSLLLTRHPHNREIKFGPDPSCVESSLLTHAHLPVFICYASETQGSWEPPKVSCSNRHGEPRVLETDRESKRLREKKKTWDLSGLSNSSAVWKAAQ